MGDITLSASVRDSLLSLQGTTNLIERTQGRLSSGLKVAGPIDDPVSFFQAKGLNDRAFDFNEKKDGIDQGISTLSAALDGVEAIETLVRQLKGVAQSMKSAEEGQMDDLISQFNDLRGQINNLANDAVYQGTNLINSTAVSMEIEFSEKTASLLTVNSVELTVDDTTGGLNIQSVDKYTGEFVVNHAVVNANSAGAGGDTDVLTAGTTINMTWQGPDQTYTTSDSISFALGDDTVSVTFSSQTVLTAGTTFDLTVNTGHNTAGGIQVNATEVTNFAFSVGSGSFAATTGNGLIVDGTNVDLHTGVAASANDNVIAMSTGSTIALTWNGESSTISTGIGAQGNTFDIDGVTFTIHASSAVALTQGAVICASITTGATTGGGGIYLVACADDVHTISAATGVYSAGEVTVFMRGTASSALSASNTYNNGSAGSLDFSTNAFSGTTGNAAAYGVVADGGSTGSLDASAVTTASAGADYVRAGDTTLANAVIDDLDSALTTLRTESQNLGTNVAVLQTRLDFTDTYVSTLESGASKLTLADINEEGANLLALQTRQQLGIQSLSFAGQAEQQILSLFR